MLPKPTVLALIPARGGSRGLPRKNLRAANGRPLIAWTIEAALRAGCVSRVVLSSEDEEIIEVARTYGCEVPFVRPAELAKDETSTVDVALHGLRELPGHDYLVLLQPTSPLRTGKDIDSAFEMMTRAGAPACVSLCAVEESPYWMYRLDAERRLEPLLGLAELPPRRQELPPIYVLSGAIYFARTDWFIRGKKFIGPDTVGYVMPRSRSMDIDTPEDFLAFQRALSASESGISRMSSAGADHAD